MSIKDRNIIKVIEEMKPLLERKNISTFSLDKISSDAFYTAPENMNGKWSQLASFVNSNIPMPPKDITDLKIVSVFMGITIEEAKRKFGGDF